MYQYTTSSLCPEESPATASPDGQHLGIRSTAKTLLWWALSTLFHLSPALGAAAGRLVARCWPGFGGA
jgi:hypothetical protein